MKAQQIQAASSADLFRCHRCGQLYTIVEVRNFMLNAKSSGPCPNCHANQFHELDPADLRFWQWLHWRVLRAAVLRLLGRV